VEQSKLGFKLLSLSVMERGGTFGKDKMIGEVLIPLDTVPRSSVGAMQARPIAAVSSTMFEINQLGPPSPSLLAFSQELKSRVKFEKWPR